MEQKMEEEERHERQMIKKGNMERKRGLKNG